MNIKFIFTFIIAFVINCNTYAQQNTKAVKIAHKVMETMGGIDNWNNIHYLKWDFGKRTLYWDKWTGDVRIVFPEKEIVVIVNINTLEGKAYKKGELVSNQNELKNLLEQGKKWWINDSYWLIMPWKLLDPGVNLKYLKTDKLPNGNTADVLQMTFKNVGVTPENKYWIYVDQQETLVKQWSFFKSVNDKKPRFVKPWDNYQSLNNILFSYNRSDFGPKNVIIESVVSDKLFNEL